jgi:hypothetical protein
MKRMHAFPFSTFATVACASTLFFSGCSSSQTAPAIGSAPRTEARHGHSSQDLLYISFPGKGKVYTYTYPHGDRVGTLSGLISPFGECVDAAGDVFIVAYASTAYESSVVYEYAHGGSQPIATLNDPGRGAACAVDPTTGNLAVSNSSDDSNPYSGYGSVAMYDQAQGIPTMHYSSQQHPFRFCGFDDRGNLYLVAPSEKHSGQFDFIGLPQDSDSFQLITLKVQLYDGYGGFTPSVQWDGKHVTVSSAANAKSGPVTVYRLDISGSTAEIVGTTELSSTKNHPAESQTWIYRKTIVGIDYYRHFMSQVSLWRYPKGGEPRRNIGLGFLEEPYGLTLSPGSQPH